MISSSLVQVFYCMRELETRGYRFHRALVGDTVLWSHPTLGYGVFLKPGWTTR
jgi:hypothetical protein